MGVSLPVHRVARVQEVVATPPLALAAVLARLRVRAQARQRVLPRAVEERRVRVEAQVLVGRRARVEAQVLVGRRLSVSATVTATTTTCAPRIRAPVARASSRTCRMGPRAAMVTSATVTKPARAATASRVEPPARLRSAVPTVQPTTTLLRSAAAVSAEAAPERSASRRARTR